ncbi:MAG: hypothetical protein HY731_13980 [Candidatus Tectomicrobia bacterium]|nr:hypothetical protein [Candidatus Tectomicrobia bacterium]
MKEELEQRLTIVDLLENHTLSLEMGAFLWLAADLGASFLVAARPREAGKSTMLQAILNFRRAEIGKTTVEGNEETFAFLETTKPGSSYIVCNEISAAPVPTYLWGSKVKTLFEVMEKGFSLAASLHAESVEEITHILSSPPLNVPLSLLARLNFVVLLKKIVKGERITRKLESVVEIRGVDMAWGTLLAAPLFSWVPERDSFETVDQPSFLIQHGERQFKEEMKRRADLLAKRMRNG